MAKYKAYAEYRDSGVEWLGTVPKHWLTEKTKRMFSLKKILVGYNSNSYQLLSLTLNGVIPRDISNGEGKIPASFDTYQSVQHNDLIFCLFDIDETPRTIGIAKQSGMITGAYNVYSCLDKCFPSFAYYYFMHIDSFKGLKPFYTGLRKVVRADTFGCIEIPNPPKEEQQQISSFLEHETKKIDNLIEKQQLLIELLKEKRQAMISHAVTKGLNLDVPKQYSGIELLGDIPLHWVMSKLRYNFIFGKGLTITKENLEDDGTPCINYGEVHSKYPFEFTPNTHQLRFVSNNYIKNKPESLLIKGDIVFADTSEDIDGSGNFTQLITADTVFAGYHTIIARPFERNNFRFYAYLLDSKELRTQVRLAVKGVKVFSVTQAILRSLSIWLPPKDEQALISSFLDHQTAKIDTLIEKQLQQIELLKERRSALISAAVTGKIDVRDWVAPETLSTQPQTLEEETFA